MIVKDIDKRLSRTFFMLHFVDVDFKKYVYTFNLINVFTFKMFEYLVHDN